jgi:hypothetical protein
LLGLLELLIGARPQALTKDEIHKSLWAGTFVSDATLTSLVAELRAAIGDDARAPRLVRTIHRYGYMFCSDVETETSPPRAGFPLVPAFRILVGDREIVLCRGEHVLGRSTEATVFIDDTGVSRQHARITIGEHSAKLEDLGSKNGTVLNGQVIRDTVDLPDAAVIVLGATALKFCAFQTTGSTETLPRPTELVDGPLPK